jgi:hypothetical protein
MVGHAEPGAVRTDIGSHALVMELRQILLHGVAQREFSLFGQQHNTDRGDRFRHGHDLEDAVLLHGTAGLDVGHAESMELHHFAARGDQRDGARDGLRVDEVFHPLGDLREDRVVHARGAGGLSRCRRETSANSEKKDGKGCVSHD